MHSRASATGKLTFVLELTPEQLQKVQIYIRLKTDTSEAYLESVRRRFYAATTTTLDVLRLRPGNIETD